MQRRKPGRSPLRTLICAEVYPLVTFLTLLTTFDIATVDVEGKAGGAGLGRGHK
jgi:hypothetical protein